MEDSKLLATVIGEANKLKESVRTSSLTLTNYLSYLNTKVNEGDSVLYAIGLCSRSNSDVSKYFKRAFKELSRLERARFYLMNLQFATNLSKSKEPRASLESAHSIPIDQIVNSFSSESKKINVFIKDGNFFKNWKNINVEVFRKQKILKITEVKEEIDLHHFLIRKSKNKNKVCLAF